MMLIDPLYTHGDIVYLKTDCDQRKRQVTAIKILPGNMLVYEIEPSPSCTHYYDFEISAEVDVITKTS